MHDFHMKNGILEVNSWKTTEPAIYALARAYKELLGDAWNLASKVKDLNTQLPKPTTRKAPWAK